MSLTAPDLLLRSENGSELEHAEVDQNWTKIQDFLTELAGIFNNIINDDGEFVPDSVNGAGIKDASLPTRKLKEIFVVTDTGTANSIKVQLDKNVSVLADNMVFLIRVIGSNTGPVSIEVTNENDLALMTGPLVKAGNKPMEAGDIDGETPILALYKSGTFYLVNSLGTEEPEIKITTSHSRTFGPVEVSLAESNFGANQTYSQNHGLGGTPTVEAVLICKASEGGYVSGDEIPLSTVWMDTKTTGTPDVDEQQPGIVSKANPTSVQFFRHSDTLYAPDQISGGATKFALTETKWSLKFTARYTNPNTTQIFDQRPLVYNFGLVRSAMTDGNFLFVIDSQPQDYGKTNTSNPRVLRVNLTNNNVSLIGNFGGEKETRWHGSMSMVPWDKSATVSPATVSITALDPVNNIAVATVTLASSLTLQAVDGANIGDQVSITGVTPSAYNGVHTVTEVVSPTVFKIHLTSNPGAASIQGNVTKLSQLNRVIPIFTSPFSNGPSKLYFLLDGALSAPKNITAGIVRNSQILGFNGTITDNFPETFYAGRVGFVSTNWGQASGGVMNAVTINKYTWNDTDSRYDQISTKTLNLLTGPTYTGKSNFVALNPMVSSLIGITHNPLKRRIYIVGDDRLLHIFEYSSATFEAFFSDASWENALSYIKTIGMTGAANNNSYNVSGPQGLDETDNTVAVNFDTISGAEISIIQSWRGLEHAGGGLVSITPWVE